MNQGDAQFGAHQPQMAGAVVGAVVDIEALTVAPTQQRLLEHGQKRPGIFGEGKSGRGDHPGGVIEEGDEIGLAPLAP